MVRDLTQGKPLRVLFFFALPMLAGNLFQQLYNMVDSMIVGRFVGQDALASVGAAFPIVFLSIAVAMGLSMGCTVVVSQQFGAGHIHEMKTTISTALISLTVLALAVMAAGALGAEPLLRLLGTPSNVLADSVTYLQIYFGGAIFLFWYNTLNAIFNALGDSQTPLMFLILSALVNIVLDYSFVVYLHMGVAGVAWATLIAQGLAAVLSFIVLLRRLRRMPNEVEGKHIYFNRRAVGRIARVGVPSMIQQSLVSVGMMMMQGLVNSYGSVFMAGYTAATKIDTIAMMPNINFSNAMSSYTAQNIGANKPERVTQGYKAAIFMSVCFSVFITIMVHLFGPQLIGIFLDANAGGAMAIGYGVSYMSVVSLFYVIMGVMFSTNGVLRGAGDMSAFMISSLANLMSRVGSAYLLAYFIGQQAIWWSIPIGWGIGACISFLRFKGGKWKERSVL